MTDTKEILLYRTEDGSVRMDVVHEGDTVWLSQKQLSELFGVTPSNISRHLKNVFESDELNQESVSAEIELTATDGKTYATQVYNLDAIIAVGYRVNSKQATHFRIWATQTLREFVIKGFVLDDERLKNGTKFGKDYFEELLGRIREIRASERRFYLKLTDLYATAADYDPTADISREFFASVQNKFHFAIHGRTAAEMITDRADATAPHMGLTTWGQAPHGKVIKRDVSIAKNCLNAAEMDSMDRLTVFYLEFAENRARRGILTTMAEWAAKCDEFLRFNDYPVLEGKGSVKASRAKEVASKAYAKFRVRQDREFTSDFDKFVAERVMVLPPPRDEGEGD